MPQSSRIHQATTCGSSRTIGIVALMPKALTPARKKAAAQARNALFHSRLSPMLQISSGGVTAAPRLPHMLPQTRIARSSNETWCAAADYVMIDPTWVGGISESRRIAELAQLYNVPVLMHDCTGPFTLLAGLNIAAAVPGVTYQECVRAHLATLYPRLIDEPIQAERGAIGLRERAERTDAPWESLIDRRLNRLGDGLGPGRLIGIPWAVCAPGGPGGGIRVQVVGVSVLDLQSSQFGL